MTSPYDPISAGPQERPDVARMWDPGNDIGLLGLDSLPLSVAELPDVYGLIYGDGFQRMRHVVRATTLPTGLLPPKGFDLSGGGDVPPVSSSGQATLFIDFTETPIIYDAATGNSRPLILSRSPGLLPNVFSCIVVSSGNFGSVVSKHWQILRQGTDAETLAIIVKAMNDDLDAANWAHPSDPSILYTDVEYEGANYVTGSKVTGHLDGLKLYADWHDHELAASRTEPPMPAMSCLSWYDEMTSSASSRTVFPQVEGSIPEGSPNGGRAYSPLVLPDTTGGGFQVFISRSNNGIVTDRIFAVHFVTSFSASTTFFEVLCAGPTVTEIMDGLQALMNGHGQGVVWQAPTQGWATAIGECGLRYKEQNGSYFFRSSPGESFNDITYILQTVSSNANAVPAFNTWVPFSGGVDPVSTTDPGGSLGVGDYRYAPSWYRQIDKARSGIGSPEVLEEHDGGPTQVTDFPTPEDPDVDFLRLWRTLVDGLGDYFKVDDVPLAIDPYVDAKSDLTIASSFGSLLYNPRHYRSRDAGYPPKNRFLARHLASVWGGGLSRSAPQVGTAEFTDGSDVIKVDAPIIPTRLWVGRYIRKDGTNDKYVIISVDEAAGEVQISPDYDGDTEAVAFTCEDERVAYATHRGQENFHNQWPARPFEGVDGVDADGITGYLARRQALYMWTRGGTWVITGSASGGFAQEPVADSVGLVNQRCLVMHDNIAYWLEGAAGFYAWDFAGPPQRISNPPFRQSDEPLGIQGTVDRINWDAIDWAHAVVDPDSRLIRWFVPIDGSEYPNYCITLDTKSMSWGEEDCPPITDSCRVLLSDGWYVLSGDAEGRIWIHDVGDSDGAWEIEPNQSIIAGSRKGITLDSAPSVDLTGASAMLVDADGERLHLARVSSQAGASLTFREELPWAPVAGNLAVLGAIQQDLIPNRFNAGVKDEEKIVPVTWVHFRKEPLGEFYLWIWNEEDGTYEALRYDSQVGDLSRTEQTERFRTNMRGYELGFRVMTYAPGFRPSLRNFELHFVVRAKAQQGT